MQITEMLVFSTIAKAFTTVLPICQMMFCGFLFLRVNQGYFLHRLWYLLLKLTEGSTQKEGIV